MSKLSKHHFWEWFKRHHHEYLSLEKKSKKETKYWLNELDAHIRANYKVLGFGIDTRGHVARLTISANGKAIHFKKADDLISKAPIIPGWEFLALEDARPIDFLLEQQIEDSGIDPREFYFSIEDDEPYNIALCVYHPLFTRENQPLLHSLAKAAIYNLLGERLYGNHIAWVEMVNLSYAQTGEIKELEALPDCIPRHRSDMAIDARGNLVTKN